MKSYISTPIVDKTSGDISYIHVPLEAAFGVGNVLYMTTSSSSSHLDSTDAAPNTPVAPTSNVINESEPQPVMNQPTSNQPRAISNLSRLFQMVGLRRS